MIGYKSEAMVIYEDSAHLMLRNKSGTKCDAYACVRVLRVDNLDGTWEYITRLSGFIQYRDENGDYTATVRHGFMANEGEAELIRAAIATFNDYKTVYFKRVNSAIELEEDEDKEQLPF